MEVRLAHIAIAVREADALAATLVAALGATPGEEELLDGGAPRGVFVRLLLELYQAPKKRT